MNRVFITGASTGLGEGLARHYAKPGAFIGLVARRAALLDENRKILEDKGATVKTYALDVSDTDAMHAAANDFVVAAGGIDLVIANAGVGVQDRVREGIANEIAWLMGVNVIGVTNTIVPFVPAMVKQGTGTLVAVSSVAGLRALPRRAAYSASKGCVITFMDAIRMDLHGTGVHAMTLCPGFVDTPLTKDNPKMIWVIDVDTAVSQMTSAIRKQKSTFVFPWQMRLLQHVLKRAPEALIRKLAPPSRTKSSS